MEAKTGLPIEQLMAGATVFPTHTERLKVFRNVALDSDANEAQQIELSGFTKICMQAANHGYGRRQEAASVQPSSHDMNDFTWVKYYCLNQNGYNPGPPKNRASSPNAQH